ncbi:hypothetical protein [Bacteroides sp. UBA939]|uniref:hypothetical protein n=1 Tax=Bacteroides sp. UBA939 TaxID=1946092 RepID=UPI0025B93A2D|nr:hypothetical protein [Bacteroides sp. UBA939]
MKKKLVLFALLLSATCVYAQKHKIWVGAELGYGVTLSDKGDLYDMSYADHKDMRIGMLKLLVGYYVTPDLSLGVGAGSSNYNPGTLNILPVFLDVRYHPFKNKRILLNGDIGCAFLTPAAYKKGKLLMDFSVGYKVLDKKVSIIPAIGYNYCGYDAGISVSDNIPLKDSQNKHSLFVKVGVIF